MDNRTRSNKADKSTYQGYICNILKRCTMDDGNVSINNFVQGILDRVNIVAVSSAGDTVIHEIVSDTSIIIENYAELIKELTVLGIDIDHQNKQGKTALHVVATLGNRVGALALLKNGADINMSDANGKTPLAIAYKKSNFNVSDSESEDEEQDSDDENNDLENFDEVLKMFAKHTHMLRYCDLHLNGLNHELLKGGEIYKFLRCSTFDRFHNEVENTKNITIGCLQTSFYEFLFKLNSGTIYQNMILSDRQEIDELFENTEVFNLPELEWILQLRYKEITQRLRLTERAINFFSILINEYELPDLCCRHILKYLTNSDLKSLILALIERTLY